MTNTVETRIRTTSTHPAVDARFAAAARLAREATARRTTPQACRAIIDALSTPALGFEGIALMLDASADYPRYQVIAGAWPPDPEVLSSAILTIPLLLDDERIGELTVYRLEGVFEESEAALITAAAAHASLGVARARLLEELAELRRRRRRPRATPARTKRKTVARKARSAKRRGATQRSGAKRTRPGAATKRKASTRKRNR